MGSTGRSDARLDHTLHGKKCSANCRAVCFPEMCEYKSFAENGMSSQHLDGRGSTRGTRGFNIRREGSGHEMMLFNTDYSAEN